MIWNRSVFRASSLIVAIAISGALAGCSGKKFDKYGMSGGVVGALAGFAIPMATASADGTEKTGIVLGSTVSGAIIGALIGHYVFDPAPPPPKGPATP